MAKEGNMLGPNHALPTDGSVTDPVQGVDTTPQTQDAAARPRLLLIEVDDAIAEVLGAVLDGEGYAVERVVSPQDALTQFLTHDPDGFDVVLTTPFASVLGDPYAWLDRLQAQTHAALVICLREPAQRFAQYRQRGYAALLREPCARQDLIDLVASVGVAE
jgi:CheY-like chemotaxis protein